ncbi:hypothetical protein CBQ28_00865 [Pseudoalteromonas sp. GCY]|uniref:hypothetical protein n=1 Tax=Pseudoalteromonas sp. GCY TaxID=2003316 RepID=UPI000BFEFBA6|nr:hypothetical protein [Pseudoalteromonas sp. GCY]PHI39101.1 hypothetical protein CBQ28_00865 [Pseudoalteromonas sp. GCY]QQQ65174.1 hypothetical protein JJQ94_00850 [Pseudoalteromonas sp. GCY]
MIIAAALLLFLIGLVHSVLGEKYILIRLFKRDNLPHLFGSDWFTKRTLRFAWHLTTIAWWGIAAMLLMFYRQMDGEQVLYVMSGTFFISGLIALIASRAIHLSWVVFFAIAALLYFSV